MIARWLTLNNPFVPISTILRSKIEEFPALLEDHLGIRMAGLPVANDDDILLDEADETIGLHADQITPEFAPYGDDTVGVEPMMPEADEMDHDAYDKYISARLMIPDASGIARSAQVKRRKRDEDGNLIGYSHSNPILDTGLYEVEFDDGQVGTYAANVIAENIYEQIDDEGFAYTLFDSIVDHKRGPDAVSADDGFTEYHGRRVPKRTTRVWKLCVRWKDDSTSWVHLKYLKESHPVQVAEYAVANKLVSEPAFNWWVKTVLRRRDRIIKAVKSRYQRREQKFGIELPKTVKRALEIDEETGTTFWRDAIQKEMKTVFPAFEFLDESAVKPIGYQQIPCHVVFDIKMDFTCKARFVAGGHVTEAPSSITYASVVSRESVRIALLIAALNNLEVAGADVQGAYLNAPCREKVFTICGPEFGEFTGRIAVVVKALYAQVTEYRFPEEPEKIRWS
jgi:hypothetical protein